MTDIKKRFDTAVTAAKAAGDILREYIKKPRQIDYKGEIDLVTDADKAAEATVLEKISADFPSDNILAEESGEHDNSSDWRWIIDPLDGTTNFAHTFPVFCTSIGVEYKGEIAAGVIYDPSRDELFHAVKGEGAFLNKERISVSKAETLETSILATGFPYDRKKASEYYLKFYKEFMLKTQGIRRCGAAAIDLAYVACGRLDGFWEMKLHPWDTAAGILLVSEAGGVFSNFSGSGYSIFDEEIIASNGRVHEEMLNTISSTIRNQ